MQKVLYFCTTDLHCGIIPHEGGAIAGESAFKVTDVSKVGFLMIPNTRYYFFVVGAFTHVYNLHEQTRRQAPLLCKKNLTVAVTNT